MHKNMHAIEYGMNRIHILLTGSRENSDIRELWVKMVESVFQVILSNF